MGIKSAGNIDKSKVLDRIKIQKKFKTDLELSRFLDIPTNTLSNWRSRNSFDLDKIFQYCEYMDWNYLFKGEAQEKVDNSEKIQLLEQQVEELKKDKALLQSVIASLQATIDNQQKDKDFFLQHNKELEETLSDYKDMMEKHFKKSTEKSK